MCRLFGMSAAPHRVHATFWLLDAQDSLAQQSRRMPDGTGLGTFTEDGTPRLEKQPVAAYEDSRFAWEAKERESATFVAHVRYATTGANNLADTHPFEQRGRLFAHNGVIEDLPKLEAELGDYRDLVQGDTDSERYFALITRHIDENDGDVAAGITAAVGWIADNLRMLSINFVLIEAEQMWRSATRTPTTSWCCGAVPEAPAGGDTSTTRALRAPSGPDRVRSQPCRRSWSRPNRWTRIPTGSRCARASFCTWGRTTK